MTPEPVIVSALEALTGERWGHADAVRLVARKPGLYAFYGDEDAWSELGLEPVTPGEPLYVGKAERSLNGRDVGTHFAAGKTGSSTVRRSLAALLSDPLSLVAVPRNLARPDDSANFALDAPSESRLSDWMQRRLTIATWIKTEGVNLDELETAIVRSLNPPLNLSKVQESRGHLRRARKRMADIARGGELEKEPADHGCGTVGRGPTRGSRDPQGTNVVTATLDLYDTVVNSYRYRETGHRDNWAIGDMYVKFQALPEQPPPRIKVTLTY